MTREKPMTICFRCKHLLRKGESRIWHDFGCARHAYKKTMCPVTGEMVPDGDGLAIRGEEYRYCRDVNRGECPDYETKGILQRKATYCDAGKTWV